MKIILFITIFTLSTNILYSHPHLFIKPSFDICITDSTFRGIRLFWKWDKWWSEDVINDCDKNHDDIFNDKETQIIYKEYFSDIKDFNYFTDILINGKKHKISGVNEFKALINKDRTVTYIFYIPIEMKIENEVKITMSFNDKTIYTAFDKNVVVNAINGYTIRNCMITDYSYYGVKIKFIITKDK